jgi:endonuclease/exonuclease/phosphatase family metal-dependent hydrolase
VRFSGLIFRIGASLFLCALSTIAAAQSTENLRVVTYNMEADIKASGDTVAQTTPRPGSYQVLEGIGEENVAGNVQPLDILALQETTSNSTTVQPIVDALNSYYGPGTYAMSTYQATQNGSPTVGNGPNAVVYNDKVLQLVSSVGVGTPHGSTNGEYRQVVRYQFRPVGGSAVDDFYVYVTHSKSSASGTAYDVEASRDKEAAIMRADAATLPASSSILYVGDFNLSGTTLVTQSGSPSVSAYQAMTGIDPLTGLNPSPGAAVDPLNPTLSYNVSWDSNSSFKGILTENSTSLRYRDDLQLMTPNVENGTGSLTFLQNSMHTFANDGSTSVGHAVGSSSTALNDLLLRGDVNLDGSVSAADIKQMLSALSNLNTYQSTHSLSNSALLAVADVNRDGTINNADLQALLSEITSLGSATAPVSRATVLADLSTASDHLPVVADYTVTVTGVGSLAAVPEPSTMALLGVGSLFLLRRRILSRRPC